MAADSLISPLPGSGSQSDVSSHLRSKTRCLNSHASAEHRVIEYLLALGVGDHARVVVLAEEIMGTVPANVPERALAELAVAAAQRRFDEWRREVFGEAEAEINALWLRTFLGAHPDVFFGEVREARARVRIFGDPLAGRPPARQKFQEQSFTTMVFPRWAKGLLAPFGITLALTGVLAMELSRHGLDVVSMSFLGLFAFLTLCGAIGLVTALRGIRRRQVEAAAACIDVSTPLPKSALVMPIYHESAEHVFAALLAMRESLARVPGGDCVEVFVLSDSREPERIAEEERAFRRTAALGDERIPMFYRRRAKNEHQKAGNLAEFFERFGHRYTYAVVLDADSVMCGETIVTLIRRMEADQGLGLLQAPLALHAAETPFARLHQFAASVYGPVLMRGLSTWAREHGNYYGHNAIVRVRAFLDCCALPRLRGEPPLGGHILSHDFVEAALLCRAGWKVEMATDLSGSFEELPPTVVEYVARDRRWCQGNLQHLRIALAADGLLPMSRIHMLMGVGAYLAGPAWLAFVVLGAVLAFASTGALVSSHVAAALSVAAATFLIGPRLVGLLDVLKTRVAREAHGGAFPVTLGVAVETTASIVLAPILMLHHARIIVSIVLGGRAVRWGAQSRRAESALGAIVRSELPTTLLGVAMALFVAMRAPGLLPWLAPVYLPWLLSIPLVTAVSSPRLGQVLRDARVHVVPTERCPEDVLVRAQELRAFTAGDSSARFRDLVLDPVLLAAKLEAIGSTATSVPEAALEKLVERALRVGPAALSPSEQTMVMSDAACLRRLHREAWQRWPVESWAQGRERAQLPDERRANT